jgi:hypothetical protein
MSILLRTTLCGVALVASCAATLSAEEVREYDQNGLRYRETKRIVPRPVYDTEWVEQTREVHKPTFSTESQPTTRTVYVPITEYRTQPVLQGRWNPFIEPYYEYRLVPVTRWEVKQETVNVPIVRQQNVTEKQTVKVPVTKLRYENEEYIRREIVGRATGQPAIGPGASSPAATTAARENRTTRVDVSSGGSIGGKSLQGDPPRYSTRH